MKKADIGLIGLAVMGENLVLNMERNGFTAAVYNRTVEKVDNFVNGRGKGKKFIACHSIKELCDNLESPRRIMMMVKAGAAVDGLIEQLVPYLDKGDIIIDGETDKTDIRFFHLSCSLKILLGLVHEKRGGVSGALPGSPPSKVGP